ncbi:unnamed protein product [Effrenium voratum]|nr:unnamed protein product [Effrenium voratum]
MLSCLAGCVTYFGGSRIKEVFLNLCKTRDQVSALPESLEPCEGFDQVVLAHLEHLADVSSIKRRRERSSADQLVRWGYALSGLKLLSTFGRKEAGGRQNRILPGWEDTGTEMAALQLPMGSMDMDRMRIRRGDSVTISGTDPLQDKLAEGTISDIRPGTLIVQLRGTFPEDCKEKLWRVDKSANATVYERQMWAGPPGPRTMLGPFQSVGVPFGRTGVKSTLDRTKACQVIWPHASVTFKRHMSRQQKQEEERVFRH